MYLCYFLWILKFKKKHKIAKEIYYVIVSLNHKFIINKIKDFDVTNISLY